MLRPGRRAQNRDAWSSFPGSPMTWERSAARQAELRFNLPRPPDVLRGVERVRRSRSIVLPAAATNQGERNFHLAPSSFGSKHVVDRSAEFIRDKVSNYVHAIAGFARSYDQGSAGLSPGEHQPITCAAVEGQAPPDQHPSRRGGKRTVLCSVGD